MKVKVTYEWEFEPDTSWCKEDPDSQYEAALEITQREMEWVVNHLTPDDFDYEVVDDNSTHEMEV